MRLREVREVVRLWPPLLGEKGPSTGGRAGGGSVGLVGGEEEGEEEGWGGWRGGWIGDCDGLEVPIGIYERCVRW